MTPARNTDENHRAQTPPEMKWIKQVSSQDTFKGTKYD